MSIRFGIYRTLLNKYIQHNACLLFYRSVWRFPFLFLSLNFYFRLYQTPLDPVRPHRTPSDHTRPILLYCSLFVFFHTFFSSSFLSRLSTPSPPLLSTTAQTMKPKYSHIKFIYNIMIYSFFIANSFQFNW